MALLKFSLRELTSRPVRVTLTVLSIVIGVAAVVSVSIATKTTRAAHERMFSAVSGRAALEVVAEGGGSFSTSVASEFDVSRSSTCPKGKSAFRHLASFQIVIAWCATAS
jgi:hypothetical protein